MGETVSVVYNECDDTNQHPLWGNSIELEDAIQAAERNEPLGFPTWIDTTDDQNRPVFMQVSNWGSVWRLFFRYQSRRRAYGGY